jgi:hypothetical protein
MALWVGIDWLFSWRWSKGKKDKNRKDKDESGGFRLVSPETLCLYCFDIIKRLNGGPHYFSARRKTRHAGFHHRRRSDIGLRRGITDFAGRGCLQTS